jgi:hypothetical protein
MAQDTVSLEQVITDFMLSIDHDDYANNASEVMVKNFALRGIREMGFDILKRIKATTLNVDPSTNTVAFPADYVDYTKIGKIGSDGLIYVFGENKNFNLTGAPIVINDDFNQNYDSYVFREYVYATTNGGMYGLGGGNYSGQYRVDTVNNRFELSSDVGTSTVYLEYIADEALAASPTIHVYAEQALRAYVYYHLIERRSSVPQGEKARARQEYYNERRLANSRLKAFSKEEALKTIRKNFKLSVKA